MSLLLLLLAANPITKPVMRSQADLVEVNHCFNARGDLQLDQVIWWELTSSGYRVIDWRILQDVRRRPVVGQANNTRCEFDGGHATPTYCHSRRRWISRWYDEKSQVRREVTATGHRETWTSFDPELEDRKRRPMSHRRGLICSLTPLSTSAR